MKFRNIACLLAVALIALSALPAAAQQDAVQPPARDKFHIFLLVGQSNMAGRGKVAAEDRQTHPRVLTLNKQQQWVPAVDPIHFDKSSAGVGLGRTFGIALAEQDPEITIGLVPCAVGGSPIDSWQPEGYHASTKTHPWDDMLPRAKLALEAGTLKGILWHQGESDSQPGKAESYEKKLHALIARLRDELNAADVPFIVGQMGQFQERPWNESQQQVDAAHRALPEKVKRTGFVSSTGLAHKGDKVHFDAASYREFGKRYAAKYLEMTKPQD